MIFAPFQKTKWKITGPVPVDDEMRKLAGFCGECAKQGILWIIAFVAVAILNAGIALAGGWVCAFIAGFNIWMAFSSYCVRKTWLWRKDMLEKGYLVQKDM